ncbi:MAG: M16 family metallopeptidase [Candidatus Puniceispirillales bacterium]
MADHAIRQTVLDSGLTVITAAMAMAESVSMGYWVRAGARDEAANQHGMAHLLEHMAFKGTRRRDAAAIAREVEDRGGFINAHTSREETAYYVRLLPEFTDFGIDLLADILTGSTFPDEELIREKGVIIQEIGQAHDTPDDIVFDRFQEVAHPGHTLGRPILGTVESVSAFSRDDIETFLAAHYAAPNIIVSAAGKVDHDDFVARVEAAFAGLPQAATPHHRSAPRWPTVTEPRRAILHRELEQTHLVLGLEGIAANDDDAMLMAALSILYGGGMSSRLFQEAREKRGLCYSVFAFHQGFCDSGVLSVYAGTSTADAEEMIRLAGGILATIAADASEEETARACAQMRSSLLMRRESVAGMCESLPRQLMIYGEIRSLESQLERISRITAADIRRLAARLIETPPVLAAIGPVTAEAFMDDDTLARVFAA